MTPSAYEATSAACAPLRTPRPTATGPLVTRRTRATSAGATADVCSRAPVTPMTLDAYTKPRHTAAVAAIRASVDEGATRNTRSSPCSSDAASHSSASSGIRSGVISPAPPAAARSRAKAGTPYRSTGFQYVMISVGTPSAAVASTVRSTSATRTPPASAASAARWMVGPSMTGSEYGSPTSTTSTPDSTMARIAAMPPSTVGNPAGRYPTRTGPFSNAFPTVIAPPVRSLAGARGDARPLTGSRTTCRRSRRPCRRGRTGSPRR